MTIIGFEYAKIWHNSSLHPVARGKYVLAKGCCVREMYPSQLLAAAEGPVANVRDGFRDMDFLKRLALIKRPLADAEQSVGKMEALQVPATFEGALPDMGYGGGQGDLLQVHTTSEGPVADLLHECRHLHLLIVTEKRYQAARLLVNQHIVHHHEVWRMVYNT